MNISRVQQDIKSLKSGRPARPVKGNSFIDTAYCLLKIVIKNPILALVIVDKVNSNLEQYSSNDTFPQNLIVAGSEGLSVKEFESKFNSKCFEMTGPPPFFVPLVTNLPHTDEDDFVLYNYKGKTTLVLDPKKMESHNLKYHDFHVPEVNLNDWDEDCQRAGDSRNIGLLPFMQPLEPKKFYQLRGIVHASPLTDNLQTNAEIIKHFNQGAPCNPEGRFIFKYPDRSAFRCSMPKKREE